MEKKKRLSPPPFAVFPLSLPRSILVFCNSTTHFPKDQEETLNFALWVSVQMVVVSMWPQWWTGDLFKVLILRLDCLSSGEAMSMESRWMVGFRLNPAVFEHLCICNTLHQDQFKSASASFCHWQPTWRPSTPFYLILSELDDIPKYFLLTRKTWNDIINRTCSSHSIMLLHCMPVIQVPSNLVKRNFLRLTGFIWSTEEGFKNGWPQVRQTVLSPSAKIWLFIGPFTCSKLYDKLNKLVLQQETFCSACFSERQQDESFSFLQSSLTDSRHTMPLKIVSKVSFP